MLFPAHNGKRYFGALCVLFLSLSLSLLLCRCKPPRSHAPESNGLLRYREILGPETSPFARSDKALFFEKLKGRENYELLTESPFAILSQWLQYKHSRLFVFSFSRFLLILIVFRMLAKYLGLSSLHISKVAPKTSFNQDLNKTSGKFQEISSSSSPLEHPKSRRSSDIPALQSQRDAKIFINFANVQAKRRFAVRECAAHIRNVRQRSSGDTRKWCNEAA